MANHEVLMLISADPPQRFQGIARLAGERGWHLRAERRHEPPRDWSGDGVLVMLEDIPPLADFVRKVRRRGIPVVDLLEDRPEVPLVRVAGDNPEIGRLAAEHFNARDFRHAAFFSVRHNHTHDLRRDVLVDSVLGVFLVFRSERSVGPVVLSDDQFLSF